MTLDPLIRRAALVLVIAAIPAAPVHAQSESEIEALRNEIEALKAGQDELNRKLDELRDMLQGRRQPASLEPIELSAAGAATLGAADAKVTLIEYSDYQCPFCARFARQTLPSLLDDYIAAGKVRLVYRDFPIRRIHPAAFEAAIAARCAGAQGKYWQMHDRLCDQQRALAPGKWSAHATALGLDEGAFGACMENDEHATDVERDLADGRRAGIRGTPTFFLGLTKPGADTVEAAARIVGARPYAEFKAEIDRLLATMN